ncbi:MAG: biotin--[acetyl-CoA-carboxylase] ligase [Limnospira sp. PMC 1291.21]|uniref:Biotin--[acetyl-CoA-carboxylase] ligase n=3 Tax=Limnospira TaxID=2596745 RepID=A0A9P1KFF8_9CYAN|nr:MULTISPECIES: biotin--[acetyl-CoA-carboxylase] ligase [Limnospira]MDC0839970.1 biotin--[acetyl-CoA-carboxylase] ligase [Limnoraphis robusta]MDY7055120.1 biotin--[acetyl-CoA-carboxylase] ligase [Limnospira fusiformis LS22]UWU48995.1 BirA family transcriptional regulator [Arthrospira platensis C1]EDZ93908.1 biotin/acetyl-CoA-carboxylase ligase [Limnospira maxima CS-328]MDT9176586.1 biotin--[acetyl-CoA-carboxylase] ligase [Limnospira sp. PMC 1238.20]
MDCDRILGALQALQENAVAVGSPTVSYLDLDASPSILIFDQLGSTNETLWELLNTGKAAPRTTVIALQQTAGRGQWGREWQSELGGLYLSYALALHQTITDAATPQHNYIAWLTQCSAWGIATVLRSRGIPVWLKWPNDLLLTKRKLGGILTETKVHKGKISQAVIGVGLNWSNSVPPTGINLQEFFNAHPTTPGVNSREMLAAIVIWGIELGLMHYAQRGSKGLMSSYMQLLLLNSSDS